MRLLINEVVILKGQRRIGLMPLLKPLLFAMCFFAETLN